MRILIEKHQYDVHAIKDVLHGITYLDILLSLVQFNKDNKKYEACYFSLRSYISGDFKSIFGANIIKLQDFLGEHFVPQTQMERLEWRIINLYNN